MVSGSKLCIRCRSRTSKTFTHKAPSRHQCSQLRDRQRVSASAPETSTRGRPGPDADADSDAESDADSEDEAGSEEEAERELLESGYNRDRLADWPVAPGIPHPQIELPDGLDEDDSGRVMRDDDIRNYIGYSPFEHLHFSEEEITHELIITVNKPRSECYQFWLERKNYLAWFNMIAQVTPACKTSCCYCCDHLLSWQSKVT